MQMMQAKTLEATYLGNKKQIFDNTLLTLIAAISISMLANGCLSRDHKSEITSFLPISTSDCAAPASAQKLPLISSGAKPTLTFHWTFSEEAASVKGASEKVRSQLENITSSKSPRDSGDSFGAGLYVAADPMSSSAHGNILVVVPIKAGCEFGFSNSTALSNQQDHELITSALTGIVFTYSTGEKKGVLSL